MSYPVWLPNMLEMSHYPSWDAYIDAVKDTYLKSFVIPPRPLFNGLPVHPKRTPYFYDFENSFFHLTHKGKDSGDRDFDIRRCERIVWARSIIENSGSPDLKEWREPINRSQHQYFFWLFDHDYIVIIDERNNHFILTTGYFIDYPRKKVELNKRFIKFNNNG